MLELFGADCTEGMRFACEFILFPLCFAGLGPGFGWHGGMRPIIRDHPGLTVKPPVLVPIHMKVPGVVIHTRGLFAWLVV